MILADENVDQLLIEALRNNAFEVYSVAENLPGIPDEKVIELSRNPPRIILTNDKDFGNWVFAHRIKDVSVVFLRYEFYDRIEMSEIVVSLFQKYQNSLKGKFTTVTVRKIRTTILR